MKKWLCFFFGHRYWVAQELTAWSRRLCCKRCGQMFAMNDDCKALVPWDAEFHRLYESHGIPITYQQIEGQGE